MFGLKSKQTSLGFMKITPTVLTCPTGLQSDDIYNLFRNFFHLQVELIQNLTGELFDLST